MKTLRRLFPGSYIKPIPCSLVALNAWKSGVEACILSPPSFYRMFTVLASDPGDGVTKLRDGWQRANCIS